MEAISVVSMMLRSNNLIYVLATVLKKSGNYSSGIVRESETECQMDAIGKIYAQVPKCQSSSNKTSEQEN